MNCDKCRKKMTIYVFTGGVILQCANCGWSIHGSELGEWGIELRLYDWILISSRR